MKRISRTQFVIFKKYKGGKHKENDTTVWKIEDETSEFNMERISRCISSAVE